MEVPFVIHAVQPSACTAGALADFAALVLAGEEVSANGLGDRIQRAHTLIFMRKDSYLVGIAALKSPAEDYRRSVFQKSNADASSTRYPHELGWVFVTPSARGQKFSHHLVREATGRAGELPLFATSRTDNPAMHASLLAASFVRHGTDYPSDRGTHRLALFLRDMPAR